MAKKSASKSEVSSSPLSQTVATEVKTGTVSTPIEMLDSLAIPATKNTANASVEMSSNPEYAKERASEEFKDQIKEHFQHPIKEQAEEQFEKQVTDKTTAIGSSSNNMNTKSPTNNQRSLPGSEQEIGPECSVKQTKESPVRSVAEDKENPTPPANKKRALPEPELEACQEHTIKKTKESPITSAAKEVMNSDPASDTFHSSADHGATEVDKVNWQGFCEIESDPSYFSVILREIGVQGITVREVPFLDPATLSYLPQPIYGLMLLFRHRQVDFDNQEKSCPSNVWFANQMPGQNSCATLAMIHTVLNIDQQGTPDVDIGEHMRQFKDFTSTFTPFQRGQAFASWTHVKKIHNSFAKKMDILENDKHLAYKVHKSVKEPRESKGRRRSEDSTATTASTDSFEDNAHHYIAFVPVHGTVYKLDGMDAQPTAMASYDAAAGESWLEAISNKIMAIMAAGDDDYGVYAISQCPLGPLKREICGAHNEFKRVERRLAAINTNWRDFVADDEKREPTSPSFLAGMTPGELGRFPISPAVTAEIHGADDLMALVARRSALVGRIETATAGWMEEEENVAREEAAASSRRWDYGPAIKRWLEMLAEGGWLEENLHLF